MFQGELIEVSRTFSFIKRSSPCYSDSWHSIAVPRRIQCSGGCDVGSQIAMTKLVEWPVVDSTPFRSLVLYTGHVYVSLSCTCSFVTGISQIWKHNARQWSWRAFRGFKGPSLNWKFGQPRKTCCIFGKCPEEAVLFRRGICELFEHRKTSNLVEERLNFALYWLT